MAIPMLRFDKADDFGVVSRGDDVAVCSLSESGALKRSETCKVIDDAIVYMQTLTADDLADLQSQMSKSPPGFRDMPSGRLPMFYRAILATRTAQAEGGKTLSLPMLIAILEAAEGDDRTRVDDYYTTVLLTIYAVKPDAVFTPEEAAYLDTVKGAVDTARVTGTPPPPPAAASSSGEGSGIGTAIALGVGGTLVGGPPGGVVGFIVGLLAGKR